MPQKHLSSVCLAAVAALAFTGAAQAQNGPNVKVGTLSCHEASGWGFVFGSSRHVRCTFSGSSGVQRYAGDIAKFGVDVGYQQSGVLIWSVVAPSANASPGFLAGHYGGITGGASVGVGLGANALIGGSGRSIALQPLSIEGTTGLNVAAGIGDLNLRYQGVS
jgi:hypothetical protein